MTLTASPIRVDVIAADATPHAGTAMGWDSVLPAGSIRLHRVSGDHLTILSDESNRKALGAMLSDAIADHAIASNESAAHPLLLRSSRVRSAPIVFVPGAGDSVTTFNDFARAPEIDRAIYGLQPRGIGPGELPHYSVEAAAASNIASLESDGIGAAVHLIGHSYGGLVALEMARRWAAAGREVASLTLIDVEPPDAQPGTLRDATNHEIFRHFARSIELRFDKTLALDPAALEAGTIDAFLPALHSELQRLEIVPKRSNPELLRGPLVTYSAAWRSVYHPATVYEGKCRLLVVRDPALPVHDDQLRRSRDAAAWRRFAPQIQISSGPGNHFTVLSPPHVQWLVEWWRGGVDSSRA